MLIKAVAYLFDKKQTEYYSTNNIVKYYCNLK